MMRKGLIDLLKSGLKLGEYCDCAIYQGCLAMSFTRESNHILINTIRYTCLGVSPMRCITFLSSSLGIRKSSHINEFNMKMLEKYKDDVITIPLPNDMHITNSGIYIRIIATDYIKVDYSGRIEECLSEYEARKICKGVGFEIVGKLRRTIARNILEELRKYKFSNLNNHFLISAENIYWALAKYARE